MCLSVWIIELAVELLGSAVCSIVRVVMGSKKVEMRKKKMMMMVIVKKMKKIMMMKVRVVMEQQDSVWRSSHSVLSVQHIHH